MIRNLRLPAPGASRRTFLKLAAAPLLAGRAYKIRDVQCMVLAGPRTYTLVKVTADDGTYGIAEAYGSPAVGTKEQILELKPLLLGKNPLEIDAIYTHLGGGGKSLSGTRTDGSART
ncbi:MAG: hypothetical protein KGN84_16540, partial [Acidobacteriota bacterium]|nr:hypothetical protein [Acidobacteriota bacterium]